MKTQEPVGLQSQELPVFSGLKTKELVGFVLAVTAIAVPQFMPGNEQLTSVGIKTMGILLAFLIILITEALPVVVTSLVFVGLMPLLGITPNLGKALDGYAEPIIFFTLASFGLSAALTTIPLSKRILRALLRKFGNNIESVLLSLMVCAAALSSIVSNVPTCAIFMAISLNFLKLYQDENTRKKSGRAFMIAIPVASMIGGMMTPAGSSINLLAMSLLTKYTGETISFVQWMVAGIPLTLVMLPLAWFFIIRTYKPAPISREDIDHFIESLEIPVKMGKKEIKVFVITCIMLTLWILSSWVRGIDVMVVAILGCCVMFLPGIRVLDPVTFLKENSWDAFFLVGTILSISAAMIDNGVSGFIAGSIPSLDVPMVVLIAFTALLIFVSMLMIPVAPSLIPIMAAPLVAVATGAGVAPSLILMTAGLCTANCYLLPLDTVTMITFSKGYYSMTDMAKSTIYLQIAMVIFTALWLPVVGKLFGIF